MKKILKMSKFGDIQSALGIAAIPFITRRSARLYHHLISHVNIDIESLPTCPIWRTIWEPKTNFRESSSSITNILFYHEPICKL